MADFFDEVFDSERAEQRKARAVRKPWWQLSKTVRQGFVMSGAYLILGVGALVVPAALSQPAARFVFGAVAWLTMSACYLISALALRRRQAEPPRAES